MARYMDSMRSFDKSHGIRCDWCGVRFGATAHGRRVDWPSDFKVNASGAMSCGDCRRRLGAAYGQGPWLFIPEVMRLNGLSPSGAILTRLTRRRLGTVEDPVDTIQGS